MSLKWAAAHGAGGEWAVEMRKKLLVVERNLRRPSAELRTAMRAWWSAAALYVVAVVVALMMLAAIAKWGYYLHPLFPNTFLRSPDISIVLGTVIVAVANIKLVMVTKKYTDIAQESIELAKNQEVARLTIRSRHGLQLNPPNSGPSSENPPEIWVANLGASSFLVQRVEIRRHDKRDIGWQDFEHRHPGEIRFDWDEVVQPGERRTLPLNRPGFWCHARVAGVDVEVVLEIADSGQQVVRATSGCFVKVKDGDRPCSIEKGFSEPRYPKCPKCGEVIGTGMSPPKGMNSFAEIDKWLELINADLARTCPRHVSDKLS